MKPINHISTITPDDYGNYIRLQGRGILDGIAGPPDKFSCHKIVECTEDELLVREYRRRNLSALPSCNWNQAAIIYTPAEYRAMPQLPEGW